MGILIKCEGTTFDKKYIIDTVELPDPECEHEYDNACDAECNLCGATRTVTHNYVDGYCTICGKKDPNKVWTIAEYPVQDTLKGLYDFGGTAEASVVNHAPTPHINTADVALHKPENITISEDYCTFTGNTTTSKVLTYLRMPLANAVTAVALFRVPEGVREIVANSTGGSGVTSIGFSLLNDRLSFGVNGALTSRTFTAINSDNFAILAVTVEPNGCRVERYTNGGLVNLVDFEGTVEAWQAGSTGNAIQIGGGGKSNIYPDADISLAAVHEGVLTDEQLESICQFVKNYGEQKGLTIE